MKIFWHYLGIETAKLKAKLNFRVSKSLVKMLIIRMLNDCYQSCRMHFFTGKSIMCQFFWHLYSCEALKSNLAKKLGGFLIRSLDCHLSITNIGSVLYTTFAQCCLYCDCWHCTHSCIHTHTHACTHKTQTLAPHSLFTTCLGYFTWPWLGLKNFSPFEIDRSIFVLSRPIF